MSPLSAKRLGSARLTVERIGMVSAINYSRIEE